MANETTGNQVEDTWRAESKRWIDAVDVAISLACDLDSGRLVRNPTLGPNGSPTFQGDPLALIDALEVLRDELHEMRGDHTCEECECWCECSTPDDCQCECWMESKEEAGADRA